MKALTITYVGGQAETFTVDEAAASEARDALGSQTPNHPIRLSEQATVFVNMRQVTSLAVGEAKDEASEEPTEEPATVDLADLTVDQLKDLLDKAGVEYPSTAKKADLVQLATDHLPSGETA